MKWFGFTFETLKHKTRHEIKSHRIVWHNQIEWDRTKVIFCILKSTGHSKSFGFCLSIFSEPSGIPKITRSTGTSSSIYLEWNPIPKDQENGPLLGYHIFYLNAADVGDYLNKHKKITVDAKKRNATITGLQSFTVYHFGVIAFNSQGFNHNLVSLRHVNTLRTEEGGILCCITSQLASSIHSSIYFVHTFFHLSINSEHTRLAIDPSFHNLHSSF